MHRSRRAQLNASTHNFNRRVFRKNIRVFKQVNIGLLAASDGSDGLVEYELLTGEWTSHHVEPPVFERALDQAHAYSGCNADKREADCSTGRPAFRQHGNWI